MTINPNKNVELDRILAGADFIEGDKADGKRELSPELVGAVMTTTVDAASVVCMSFQRPKLIVPTGTT